jgi:hypothetical protein
MRSLQKGRTIADEGDIVGHQCTLPFPLSPSVSLRSTSLFQVTNLSQKSSYLLLIKSLPVVTVFGIAKDSFVPDRSLCIQSHKKVDTS